MSRYYLYILKTAFPSGSVVKILPVMQETRVQPLFGEDLLKEGMTTHSSIAWSIPMDRGIWQAAVHGSQSDMSERLSIA